MLIGDVLPHKVTDYEKIKRRFPYEGPALDWREECDLLAEMVW